MKTTEPPRIGIIDALTAGVNHTARHPWLMLIPFSLDIVRWLVPRISIEGILHRGLQLWQSLLASAYTQAQISGMADMLEATDELVRELGQEVNLAAGLSGGWLGAPSALAASPATRLTLVSDGVLAPLGFVLDLPRLARPWQAAAIDVGSVWLVLLMLVVFWLVGQTLATIYLRYAARSLPAEPATSAEPEAAGDAPAQRQPPQQSHGSWRGLVWLVARFAAFNLILGAAILLLRVPLVSLLTLSVLTGGGSGLAYVFVGGITLWLTMWVLVSFFFTSEAVLLDGQPLLASLWQSMLLVRGHSVRTLGLVIMINVLMLGFRALWGLIGQTPAGALAAILGNAFLATAMVLSVFVYYKSLRRQKLPARARPPSRT